MKKSKIIISTLLFIVAICFSATISLAQTNTTEFWKEQNAKKMKRKNKKVNFPTSFKAFTIDAKQMKEYLNSAPSKKENTKDYLINLPLPNCNWETFSIYSNSLMSKELAAKYPDITTFNAEGKTSNLWSGKLDYTTKGFHAMLYNGSDEILIQPIKEGDLTNYIVFYKKDAIKNGKYLYESKSQIK